MSGVPNRPSVGFSRIGFSGSEAAAVVQMVPPPEVDWAAFSALKIQLGVLSTEGNFKSLPWSDSVSKVVIMSTSA